MSPPFCALFQRELRSSNAALSARVDELGRANDALSEQCASDAADAQAQMAQVRWKHSCLCTMGARCADAHLVSLSCFAAGGDGVCCAARECVIIRECAWSRLVRLWRVGTASDIAAAGDGRAGCAGGAAAAARWRSAAVARDACERRAGASCDAHFAAAARRLLTMRDHDLCV